MSATIDSEEAIVGQAFGQTLKRLRETRGLTLELLAAQASLTMERVTDIESGSRC